jgi:hypothetical protein
LIYLAAEMSNHASTRMVAENTKQIIDGYPTGEKVRTA